MKMIKFMAFLMFGGLFLASCSDDEKDNDMIVTFEGTYYNNLIDTKQYGGELLYGENAKDYSWTDKSTSLKGAMTNAWGGQYGFAEGGVAISNYVDGNAREHNTFDYQLEVPVSNGSKNFAVVYCNASVQLTDGTNRLFKSMDICPTTYLLGCEKYGNTSCPALGEKDFVTATITGFAIENPQEPTGFVTIDLARDGKPVEGWQKVDLTKLGKCNRLEFSMTGSVLSDWGGMAHPSYFAFDNVVIEK